jgi:ABC-type dipeptide/oligopeptide/nickel transport system ATPase component
MIIVIFGESFSGKSTLSKMIMDFVKPDFKQIKITTVLSDLVFKLYGVKKEENEKMWRGLMHNKNNPTPLNLVKNILSNNPDNIIIDDARMLDEYILFRACPNSILILITGGCSARWWDLTKWWKYFIPTEQGPRLLKKLEKKRIISFDYVIKNTDYSSLLTHAMKISREIRHSQTKTFGG